jgi:hypothetical protein
MQQFVIQQIDLPYTDNGSTVGSVADPDNFWTDPDPTFENVRIRYWNGVLIYITF